MTVVSKDYDVAHISGMHQYLLLDYVIELIRASNSIRIAANDPDEPHQSELTSICDVIDAAIDVLRRFACHQDMPFETVDDAFQSLYVLASGWPNKTKLNPKDRA